MDDRPLLRFLFVCRGSTRDGLGHVMRSRSVAQEVARRASVRLALVGDRYVEPLLAGRGLRYEILDGEQQDESGIAEIIQDYRPDIVVFDALRVSAATMAAAKRTAMTVSLSPVFDHLSEVDVIFHRTAHHGEEWNFEPGQGPTVFSSLDYAVVRDNCVRISEEQFRQNLEQDRLALAVTMGGADAGNKTLKMLQALSAVPRPLLIWALLGEGYAHSYEALVECVRRNTRHEIILAKTSDSMWRVMRTCCLAVLAGGTVTYESVFAGLPSINVFDQREHLFLVRELVERGICQSAGFPLEDALDVAAAGVVHLESHREELLEMHRRTVGLVDGCASRRIAEQLVDHYWDCFVAGHPERTKRNEGRRDGQNRAA